MSGRLDEASWAKAGSSRKNFCCCPLRWERHCLHAPLDFACVILLPLCSRVVHTLACSVGALITKKCVFGCGALIRFCGSTLLAGWLSICIGIVYGRHVCLRFLHSSYHILFWGRCSSRFEQDARNQLMPGQRSGMTYVSRLQSMQAAIDAQLEVRP